MGTTFGLVLALVFWVYFSGLVLCLGALVTLLSEKRRRAEAHLPTHPPERPIVAPAPDRFAPAEGDGGAVTAPGGTAATIVP